MHPDIQKYNATQTNLDREVCELLAQVIDRKLPDAKSKIWHGHPVWFLEGNPIVGYNKSKTAIGLLFWSGQSFDTTGLKKTGKFKAAEAKFTFAKEIDTELLSKWLAESRDIQWDYKNIVKRKGRLDRLK